MTDQAKPGKSPLRPKAGGGSARNGGPNRSDRGGSGGAPGPVCSRGGQKNPKVPRGNRP